MSETSSMSRREFGKMASAVAAASALTQLVVPAAHAAGSDLIQVALIGCGGRGSGAIVQALDTKSGPTKLVAMADAYDDRLASSYQRISKQRPKQVDVPEDRRFIGFDAYQKAMDCLKPGDVVILTTPLAFRWVHFTYAIQKGLNVFMEKPLTADGPTSKKMFKLAEEASAKNLKCGVGLMSRHARPLQELAQRIQDGQLGDIILMRGYRMMGQSALRPKPANMSELEFQVRRFHSFLWAGGGNFSDFYIHIIDQLCWMKGSWPVSVQALAARQYQKASDGVPFVDQNLDVYATEYTFADGTKLLFDGRCMTGCFNPYASYIHGSKGMAIGSRTGDCGAPASIYKGQLPTLADRIWVSTDSSNPYQNEWDELMEAIRNDKPYNEVKRGVEASLVTSMGRMASHTGQDITYDQMLNCEHEMAPGVDKLTKDSPAPVLADANGMYPVPQPGIKKNREY
jgi:predicted dehydrogenase